MPTLAQRHRALQQRSFARHLDLFLTVQFGKEASFAHLSPDLYEQFIPTTQEWDLYVRSHQAKSLNDPFIAGYSIQDVDRAIKEWGATSAAHTYLYREAHDRAHCLSLARYEQLFAPHPLACAYCRITQAEFTRLSQAGQLHTKRLRTRGTSFELDCVEPRLGYQAGNVVACCYWCNNAKTDEFTDREFAPVARAFEQVWRGRLKKGDKKLAN